MSDSTIVLPSNWIDLDNNTLSTNTDPNDTTVGTALAMITLVPSATGTGSVEFSGTGPGSSATSVTRSKTINVSWTVVSCVTNQPPSVDAGGSYSGDEGSAIQLDGTATDPDNDPLTYAWTYSTPVGVTCAFSDAAIEDPTLTCDDNGSVTVTLTVSDGHNPAVSDSASVAVANAAPTATLGNNGPINEGGSATVSFSGASDPSSVDSASLHYAFACAGGSLAAVTYADGGTSDSTSCAFADNGAFTVSGKIMDKDGGSNEYATVVTVANVAPDVTLTGPNTANEGQTVAYTSPSLPRYGHLDPRVSPAALTARFPWTSSPPRRSRAVSVAPGRTTTSPRPFRRRLPTTTLGLTPTRSTLTSPTSPRTSP